MKFVPKIVLIVGLTFLLMKLSTTQDPIHDNQPVARIWHGWTTPENADEFEKALTEKAIPGIEANKPEGLRSITLLRRDKGVEIEFTTIMYFNSIADVKSFAGEEYWKAHMDAAVKPLLARYDALVEHHQVSATKIW